MPTPQRSYNMSRIRGKDTKPKMIVRKFFDTSGEIKSDLVKRFLDTLVEGKEVAAPGDAPTPAMQEDATLPLADAEPAEPAMPHVAAPNVQNIIAPASYNPESELSEEDLF